MQLATVKSVGFGVGYFGTAPANAREDAKRAVAMLLALARCPRCGRRDEGVAATNRRSRNAAQIAIGFIFALFTVALYGIGMELAAIAGGVVMGMSFWYLRHVMIMRYPTEVTDEVTFADVPQPTWTPVALGKVETHVEGGWKWM